MSEENVQLAKSAYEAFGRGNIPGVLGVLSEDVEWNAPAVLPQGGQAHGRDEVGQFFERVVSNWSDFVVEPEDFVASGDRVCVIGSARGKLDGTDAGYGFVHAWTVRDGAMVRFDEYVDPSPELLSR
jgi:uncharacterized protein